jgi:hypothetical protein
MTLCFENNCVNATNQFSNDVYLVLGVAPADYVSLGAYSVMFMQAAFNIYDLSATNIRKFYLAFAFSIFCYCLLTVLSVEIDYSDANTDAYNLFMATPAIWVAVQFTYFSYLCYKLYILRMQRVIFANCILYAMVVAYSCILFAVDYDSGAAANSAATYYMRDPNLIAIGLVLPMIMERLISMGIFSMFCMWLRRTLRQPSLRPVHHRQPSTTSINSWRTLPRSAH